MLAWSLSSENVECVMSGTLTTYERIAKSYRRRAWKLLTEFVLQGLGKGEVIADLGCGKGDLCRRILELSNQTTCLGIDLSFNMLEEDLRGLRGLRIDYLNPLIVADISHLPLRDSIIDKAVSASTLHHLALKSERIEALKETKRVLKNGGKALITVWSRYQPEIIKEILKDFINYLLKHKESIWDLNLCSNAGCRSYHFYSLSELIKEAAEVGLKVIKYGVYEPQKISGVPSKNYFIKAVKT